MQNSKFIDFENRLKKVYKHFSKFALKQQWSCFRFYDHDMPEFPFIIEHYKDYIYAAEYKRKHGMDEETHEQWLQQCKEIISNVCGIVKDNIFIKVRQRKEGKEGQYQKISLQKTETIVQESGLSFIINLSDYLDTGLFLDHRLTRMRVREEAEGKRVLNLFCYTGSFSVYAAAGKAACVYSVDMSKTYINWAKRNMQYNKLYQADRHEFIQADVLEWLQQVPPDSFDLIICDPPTFSNSKRMEGSFDVQRDHVPLLKKLLKICSPEGSIYFSNNYRGFSLDRDALPASIVKDITAATTPFDFQSKLHRCCFFIQK